MSEMSKAGCLVVGSEHRYARVLTGEFMRDPVSKDYLASYFDRAYRCPGCGGPATARVVAGPMLEPVAGDSFLAMWRVAIAVHESPQEAERRFLYGDGSREPRGVLRS